MQEPSQTDERPLLALPGLSLWFPRAALRGRYQADNCRWGCDMLFGSYLLVAAGPDTLRLASRKAKSPLWALRIRVKKAIFSITLLVVVMAALNMADLPKGATVRGNKM